MPNLAELLVRLEKRIIILERLAGIEPDVEILIHPKSMKQAGFRAAEDARKAAELEATKGIIK